MHKLSVITINFNNKIGIEKTIKSVISQTFTDFEYIIIDGGSNDGSADIIEKYKNKITYYVSEKDSGIYNAMNKGIEKSSGEYCFFLNSGDTLYDSKVFQDVFSIQTQADIIYGNLIFAYPSGAKRKGVMPAKLSFRHMIQDTLWHPVSFIRKKLFTTIGKFDEQYFILSDYDFFVKAILLHKVITHKINRIITVFSQDGISALPANKEKILAERREVQLKYFNKKEIDAAAKTSIFEVFYKRFKRRIGI